MHRARKHNLTLLATGMPGCRGLTPNAPNVNRQFVNQRIAELKSINLSQIEFNELKKLITPILFDGYARVSCSYHPGLQLFRGKPIPSKYEGSNIILDADKHLPKTFSALAYRSAKTVENYGRAHSPGKPMFYCSKAPEVTIHELNLNIGDFAVISKWETIHRLTVVNIGYEPEVFLSLESDRACPDLDHKVPELIEAMEREDNKSVSDFFSNEFMKRVDPGNEYLYKLSAAIAETLRGELGDTSIFPELKEKYSEFQGIEYPAIKAKGNADNLALIPTFVDQSIKFIRCELVLVENDKKDILIVDTADEILDGKVMWKERQEPSKIFCQIK